MKIYLAGPMRGYKDFNAPAFREAAEKLRNAGHDIFVPPDESIKLFGQKMYDAGGEQGSEAKMAEKLGVSELDLGRTVFFNDLTYICKHADAVALLPGWQNSKGATAEHAVAKALGLKVIELEPPRDYGVDLKMFLMWLGVGIASGVAFIWACSKLFGFP